MRLDQAVLVDLRREGPGAAWAAHRIGRSHQFRIIERLDNLARLPSRDFWSPCFPIEVRGGSAGWVRAVALLPGGDREDDE